MDKNQEILNALKDMEDDLVAVWDRVPRPELLTTSQTRLFVRKRYKINDIEKIIKKEEETISRVAYDKIIEIIKKRIHVEYVGNGYPKNIIDTNGVSMIEQEMKELVRE